MFFKDAVLDAKTGITFHGEKDISGKYIEGTVTLSFDNPQIAIFLKEWADMWTELSNFDKASENYEKHLQENVLNKVMEENMNKDKISKHMINQQNS